MSGTLASECFVVIDQATTRTQLKIKEAVHIHWEKPSLNQQLFHVNLRACLHGGGGPQVGEVTRLAVVEKWPAFTCKLTTLGSRGDFT